MEIGGSAVMAFVATDEGTAQWLVGSGIVLRLEEESPVCLCILRNSVGLPFIVEAARLKVLEVMPVLEVRPGGIRGHLRKALRAAGLIEGDGPPDRPEGVYFRAVLPPVRSLLAWLLYEAAFVERKPDRVILHAFVSYDQAPDLALRLERVGSDYRGVPFRRLA